MFINSNNFRSINCRHIILGNQETKQLYLEKNKYNELAILYPNKPILFPIADNKAGFYKFTNFFPINSNTKINSLNNTNINRQNIKYINPSNIFNIDSFKNINDNSSNNNNVYSTNNILTNHKEVNLFYSLDLIKEILNKYITDPIIKIKLIEEHTIEHLRNYKFIKYKSIKGERGNKIAATPAKEQKRKRGDQKLVIRLL